MAAFSSIEEVPRCRYGVIAADPPWHFKVRSNKGEGRSATRHYRTMTLEDIKALPVADLAAPDCALLLWGTSPHLLQVIEVLHAWGFRYSGKAFCWAKTYPKRGDWPAADPRAWHMGNGYTTRANSEDVWLGVRGSPRRISAGVKELIATPRREHSRKPDEFYQRALQLYPGPHLELFGREERDGWDVMGDQVGRFDVAAT